MQTGGFIRGIVRSMQIGCYCPLGGALPVHMQLIFESHCRIRSVLKAL